VIDLNERYPRRLGDRAPGMSPRSPRLTVPPLHAAVMIWAWIGVVVLGPPAVTKAQIVETDCGRYGSGSPAQTCPAGREFHGSTCVLACPEGWTRSAACSCQRGTGPVTD
jgi:hypothetical protein